MCTFVSAHLYVIFFPLQRCCAHNFCLSFYSFGRCTKSAGAYGHLLVSIRIFLRCPCETHRMVGNKRFLPIRSHTGSPNSLSLVKIQCIFFRLGVALFHNSMLARVPGFDNRNMSVKIFR